MHVLPLILIVCIVAVVSRAPSYSKPMLHHRTSAMKKITPINKHEAIDMFEHIKKTCDGMKSKLRWAIGNVTLAITLHGTALDAKLKSLFSLFKSVDDEVFKCFIDTKMIVARSFIAGFKNEKICKELKYEHIQNTREIESVEEKDTSIVCLLRSVFKLIDAIEDAEITAMKEMGHLESCDSSIITGVDAHSSTTLSLFAKDLKCMLIKSDDICNLIGQLEPSQDASHEDFRTAMLKALLFTENSFKQQRSIIEPFFASIKASTKPSTREITRALNMLETLLHEYTL